MTDRRQAESLARLQVIAQARREAELARLATIAQSRARLQSALEACKRSEAPLDPAELTSDPAMVTARLAHRRWIEVQQRRLNQQLALVTADWLRQKPAAARAFGRAAVFDQLSERARDARRREREARGTP